MGSHSNLQYLILELSDAPVASRVVAAGQGTVRSWCFEIHNDSGRAGAADSRRSNSCGDGWWISNRWNQGLFRT
jgi:hypothetical protein